MLDEYNPIKSVDGVAISSPASYVWKLQDVSAPDAGRSEAGNMDKMRIGQLVGLELSWRNITIPEASKVLKAFNPEYVTVCYLDAMSGKYETVVFYVGDRSSPLYNAQKRVWDNVSFNLIERSCN